MSRTAGEYLEAMAPKKVTPKKVMKPLGLHLGPCLGLHLALARASSWALCSDAVFSCGGLIRQFCRFQGSGVWRPCGPRVCDKLM